MAVEVNKSLVESVRKNLNNLPWKQEEAARKAITDYETACKLSRGPDQARAKHWSSIAADREHDLRRFTQTAEKLAATGLCEKCKSAA